MILKNDPGIKGSLTFYQLYVKSLHIYWALNLDHNSLGSRLDSIWGRGWNCLFLQPSVLLFEAGMFVLQACGMALTLGLPSLPSRIGPAAPSCPL